MFLHPQNIALKIVPFGSPMIGRDFSSGNYRFGFNGQEKDNEVYGNGNANTATFWEYDTRLGRRWNIDPESCPSLSNYHSFKNSPIILKDPDGRWPFWTPTLGPVIAYFVTAKQLENSEGDNEKRQAGYAMLHPINAYYIMYNANVAAANFQVNIGKAIGKPQNEEGSPQNAIRHTLWQSIITRDLGAKHAERIARAHETTTKVDLTKREFEKDKDAADRTIDLLNNQIGREIGEKNKDANNQTLAKKVVDEYTTNGLWTLEKDKKGNYSIHKTKLTKEQHDSAVKEIDKKGDDGLNKSKK